MGKAFSRPVVVSRIHYFPAQAGCRAVFLAEARNRKEVRQIRELFDMVGRLAQVVPISDGTVMSYAVQTHGDPSFLGKIEWLLKTQFAFSLVERNFSDVTFHLVQSLCEDSKTQLAELPECGICATPDPFPTRATVEVCDEPEPMHLAYCLRCSATHAEVNPAKAVVALLEKDRRRFHVTPDVPVMLMPEMVDEKPEWERGTLAIAG